MRRHRRTRHICSFTAHRRLLLPGHICRRLLVLLALSAYEWVTDDIFFFEEEQGRGAVGGGGGRKRSMHFAHFEILHIVYREVLLLCYCYYC